MRLPVHYGNSVRKCAQRRYERVHGARSRTPRNRCCVLTPSNRIAQCESFRISPQEGSVVTDPVCQMLVDEATTDIKEEYAGKTYFFCSDECRERFQTDPEHYVQTAA